MFEPAPQKFQKILCPRCISFQSPLSELALSAQIVIGICIRNQAKHLPIALASAMTQTVIEESNGVVVILDDNSKDNWQADVSDWLDDPRVITVSAVCGSAARARNALLDWVDSELPTAKWIARLDADDYFAERNSVQALIQAGNQSDSLFVLGSNHLAVGNRLLPNSNIAEPSVLLVRQRLLNFIEAFCLNGQQHELPSCNLLLRVGSGIRYPDVKSAEDHWLVAQLLMFEGHRGEVVSHPVYAVYSLGGVATEHNRKSSQWKLQRERLATAANYWIQAINVPGTLLGIGQEGIVWTQQGQVYKQFYPWAMDKDDVQRLCQITQTKKEPVPATRWLQTADGSWQCSYSWFASNPLPKRLSTNIVRSFLKQLHRVGYVTSNIKRSNMRLDAIGQLVYIDIGKDIVPFSASRFLDATARLYSIGILGYSDYELARRHTIIRQYDALGMLPGFADFYRALIEELYPHCKLTSYAQEMFPRRTEERVTLLIKSCGQDVDLLENQVKHIVSQFCYPANFAKIVLLIDPYQGPFLRQYTTSDLPRVQQIAQCLLEERLIDEVWEAPQSISDIKATYYNWFGRNDISASHTCVGAPLFAQLWAFDRVVTPYVLQCDVDILIGRRELTHDFLGDMFSALETEGVISVGFNIPQLISGFKSYQGHPGQFAPEIRCGMLHLPRMRTLCPLPNTVKDDRFELMWHRSVQQAQVLTKSCSLRGGDSRTFYLHPMNSDKKKGKLTVWRDLVAQGPEPIQQKGVWDLLPNADWKYSLRDEELVFLLKGRNTHLAKLQRCIASLKMQEDQRFGVILIDDGSQFADTWYLPLLLGNMFERTTLIRQREQRGYILNFFTAVNEICSNSDTLIVTLDLDDALMSSRVSARLMQTIADGVDLVNGVMFRPEKPFHLYEPDYRTPRIKGGGNVWAHLRGFRKRLFDALPKHYLQVDEKWVEEVTDYAIMLPLCELAQHPVFIDDLFCYYHQRKPYPASRKATQQAILNALFSLPTAQLPYAAGRI